MKRKFLSIILISAFLALSACGSAEPTLNPQDQASTAMAEAWLAITQTQAALPSATPVPPSNTPEPTLTPPPPTIAILPTLPPATEIVSAPTQDECNQVPPIEPKGAVVKIEVKNESGGSVNLSLGMNSPNEHKECVTYSFVLGNNANITAATVLAGCYWGWGWVDAPAGKEDSIAKTGSNIYCMTNTSLIYHLTVTRETIDLK